MAARLNTRLIALVTIASIGAVGVVGAFAALRYRADATRNVRQGDELMAAGEYSQALGAYGRAVSKQPSNLQYLEKAMEALSKVTPATSNDLRERFNQLQAMQERRIGIAPNRAQSHLDVIQLRLLLAAMGDGSASSWERVEEAGRRMAESLDDDDPARLDGELYAAVGALGRLRLLEPAQFDAAIAAVRNVVAQRPGDDLANATLIDALLGEGNRRLAANRADARGAELITQGRAALQQALVQVPNGPLVANAALRELLAQRDQGVGDVTQAQIDEAVARVVRSLEEAEHAWVADRALASLLISGDRNAMSLAADAIGSRAQRDPEDLLLRQIHMLTLSSAGRLDDCAAQAEQVLAAAPRPVGVDAWLQTEGKVQAAATLFNIAYEKLLSAPPEQREEARRKAEQALDRLRAQVEQPDVNPSFIRSRARVSSVAGRWTDSLADLEQVIRLVGEQEARPDLLFEAAYAAAQAGETGLARRRIGQSLTLAPRSLDALLLQADLEQRVGELEAARRSIGLARQIAPEDERVLRMTTVLEFAGQDGMLSLLQASQQRFDRGDVDGARRMLTEAIEQAPKDVRLYRAATFVELASGQEERAVELAKAGLALDPEDQLLNRALVIASTRDGVERIVRSIEAEIPDPSTRIARTYAALTRAAHVTRRAADEASRAGRSNAETLDADARKLEEAAASYATQAVALDPPLPLVTRIRFEDALERQQFDDAQSILQRDEASPSPLLGAAERAIMQAQLLLTRAEQPTSTPAERREFTASAVRVLEAAIQRNPENTDLHRLLGQAFARLGNLQRGLASLEVAYSQRPTDMGVVEAYASVLQALGEQQRLLQVLRAAARQRDVSSAVRTAWLAAEAAIGDRRAALAERRAMHQTAPDDLANGVALATLLLTMPPTRELIVDSTGRERIPADRWSAMNEVQQRAALDGVRKEWMEEARRVAQTLAQAHPDAFEVATIRADLERGAGRPDAGLAVLQEFVTKAGENATSQVLLTLGTYQEALGRESDAFASYEAAIQRQGPMREADRFLSFRAVEAGRFDLAIPHLRALAEVSDAQSDQVRLAEALGRNGQVDEAEAILNRAIETYGLDADCAMLDASIAEKRLDTAVRSGQMAGVDALQQRIRTSIRRAQELRPNDPVPLVGEAQAILAAWQRKPQRSAGDREVDEAMALLDRALAQRADHWPAIKLRVGLFADRGDLTRARSELERLLALQPGNDEARLALIDLWTRVGSVEKAIAVARQGIDARPFDARMRRVLGDLHDRAGDLPRAIEEHRRAAELQPSGGTERLVMLMLRDAPGHPPEFANVVQFLTARPQELARSLYLEAAYAAALANTGKRQEGLDRLRGAHAEYVTSTAARPELLNGWYDMLWLTFPPARFADAEAFVREATGGKPTAFDLRELAVRLARSGPPGLERARELLAQALASAEAIPPASRAVLHFDMGNVLYAMNRCLEAIPAYEEGLSFQPSNPGILNNLAYLLSTCANDPARALPLAQRAVALAPSEWAFRDTLADTHARLGQLDVAEREYRAALALSRQAATHIKLAQLMAGSGRKSEARGELRRALEVDPRAKDLPEYLAAEAASR
jgi:tetratricopeptide (TPR) repeat protein